MSAVRDAIQSGEAAELQGDFVDAAAAYGAALDDPDRRIVADAHFRLGRVSWRQGRYDEALAEYETARAMAMEIGDAEIRARAENGVGAVHYARGAYAQARAAYGVALDITTEPSLRGKITLNLGVIANIEGDLPTAREYYQRSRAIFRQAGDGAGEVLALHNLGMHHADVGEWDEADEAYARCLELCEEQGNRQMIANVLLNRSELSIARGSPEDAIAACDHALALYDRLGDEVGRGEALRWRGHALVRMKRLPEAEHALDEAIRIARRAQVRLLEAESLRDLGESRLAAGDRVAATQALRAALALFEQLGAQREVAEIRQALD